MTTLHQPNNPSQRQEFLLGEPFPMASVSPKVRVPSAHLLAGLGSRLAEGCAFVVMFWTHWRWLRSMISSDDVLPPIGGSVCRQYRPW